MSETNEETTVESQETTEEKETSEESNEINERLTKLETELSKRDETIGSLKRELKDSKKKKAEPKKETPEKTETGPDLQTLGYLELNGITEDEEVELALEKSKKWDMPVNKVVKDEDFKRMLEKHRDQKANVDATSNVKGDKGKTSAKNTPEYWIAKGAPPTAEQVPDRKDRAAIARAMMASAKEGKKFYNE